MLQDVCCLWSILYLTIIVKFISNDKFNPFNPEDDAKKKYKKNHHFFLTPGPFVKTELTSIPKNV